jgi:hypothetical protein
VFFAESAFRKTMAEESDYSNLCVVCCHFFRLLASYFLVLVPQKVTKEDDTQPSRPDGSLALLNLGLSSVNGLHVGVHQNSP